MGVQATQLSCLRTLEIAAVGTNNVLEVIEDGDILAVNGITGEIIIIDEQAAEFKAAEVKLITKQKS